MEASDFARTQANDAPKLKGTTMAASEMTTKDMARRLHIGGKQVKEGWKILNIQPGKDVDFVGDAADLSQFNDEIFDEVYASHVIEHLGYQKELPAALKGIYRIIKPSGIFRMSVPDLETLCKLFLHGGMKFEGKFEIMRMMFGGQGDEHDFHKIGFTFEIARRYLGPAGFKMLRRVREFGIFDDFSSMKVGGMLISLNIEAWKERGSSAAMASPR